jgi:hypothetical protein
LHHDDVRSHDSKAKLAAHQWSSACLGLFGAARITGTKTIPAGKFVGKLSVFSKLFDPFGDGKQDDFK